ncbi:hypothetical protein O204_13215 [Pseudomonas simiae]|uniref:Uncharacterized protein n=1 Tax=Pseudomonas simiae TaxID=321846 RepID=U1TYW4_9PSED|nr:hypothetical protein O204_13215 [Pseudomonas simiae]
MVPEQFSVGTRQISERQLNPDAIIDDDVVRRKKTHEGLYLLWRPRWVRPLGSGKIIGVRMQRPDEFIALRLYKLESAASFTLKYQVEIEILCLPQSRLSRHVQLIRKALHDHTAVLDIPRSTDALMYITRGIIGADKRRRQWGELGVTWRDGGTLVAV